MPPFYASELAALHDAHFGDLARAAADRLVGELQRRRIGQGLVVDLGCGSGITSQRIQERGYDVLGVDISPDMIALARSHAPLATIRVGSLWEVKLPPCVAVAAIGEALNYSFDPAAGRSLTAWCRRAVAALAPGGVILGDVATPGRVPSGEQRVHHLAEDWAVLMTAEERGRRLTRQITTFRRHGAVWRRADETHQLRLLSTAEIAAALRQVGFRVRTLSGYGPRKLAAGHAVFLAVKPKRP